ncbi:cyclophane-containing RiPP N-acetyltransferase HaaN [Streptomyces sp. ATCC 21386]|uniref:cyclophane-containing RiPP N-acetyltransferase HaaN n=1 Tax=Streptomyces sp. ATCC 21386 TaxID=2699428 RepID=UPI001BFF5266|nr:cyclophane-containing RiPP N-acetyltransferase HaaN [Streptomyces sp. ATCC 21386]
MSMRIRPAGVGDVRALARLIEEIERFYGATEIQPFEERRSQVRQALFGSPPLASALLVEDGRGDIVGMAAYSFLWPAAGSSHSLFLKELYVRDSLRRQGVGKALMRRLRDIAQERPGCSRLEWMTDRENEGARSFYRELGFTEFDGKIVYRLETGAGVTREPAHSVSA